jgi:hypothetical protein
LLASTALPHFAPLGRVTTRLKLIQILVFVPWHVRLCHSGSVPAKSSSDWLPVSPPTKTVAVDGSEQSLSVPLSPVFASTKVAEPV